MTETLAAALEREHCEIDTGIADFLGAQVRDEAHIASLQQALTALRRHIYLEEEFLFPPLLDAGLFAPVFVMLREHGEIWSDMDALETRLRDDPADGTTICQELVSRLEAHNAKEEAVIYPQADAALNAEASAELHAFLAVGEIPPGWICAQAGA